MAGHDVAQKFRADWIENDYKRPSPFALAASLPNMPVHYVSRETGAVGPISAVSVACATGAQALGDAALLIRLNRADMVFCGGVESMMTDYAVAGFDAMIHLYV